MFQSAYGRLQVIRLGYCLLHIETISCIESQVVLVWTCCVPETGLEGPFGRC